MSGMDVRLTRFYDGFFQALQAAGAPGVVVDGDVHQVRFAAAAAALRRERALHRQADLQHLPEILPRDPVTGRYRDFDDAILMASAGGTRRFPEFSPTCFLFARGSPASLEEFTAAEKAVLEQMVTAYAGALPRFTTRADACAGELPPRP